MQMPEPFHVWIQKTLKTLVLHIVKNAVIIIMSQSLSQLTSQGCYGENKSRKKYYAFFSP